MSFFRRLLRRNHVSNTLKPAQQRLLVLSTIGAIAIVATTLLTGFAFTHSFPSASSSLTLSSVNGRSTHTDMQSSSGIDDLANNRKFLPTHTAVTVKKGTPASIQSQPISVATPTSVVTTVPTQQPTPSSVSGALIPVNVTAYALQGRMADGNWTHFGACAVYTSQFPFGTLINIYNRDGSFNRQCIAEDTG